MSGQAYEEVLEKLMRLPKGECRICGGKLLMYGKGLDPVPGLSPS